MAVKFDWDPKKAEANRHKHKVSFAQACDVWNDTLAIDEPDDRLERFQPDVDHAPYPAW
jgi:uncharacterized DUF497 family protein